MNGQELVNEVNEAIADWTVLSRANAQGKFAIDLYMVLPERVQLALERGQEREWYRLIDISPLAVSNGRIMRVFMLTDAGRARLAVLTSAKEKGTVQ